MTIRQAPPAEPDAPADWMQMNRRALEHEVDALRQCLGGASRATGKAPKKAAEYASAALAEAFGLTPFERSVLLLCAGVELAPDLAALCAAHPAGAGRAYPTFGLALAALPEPHWTALAPTSALRRWRLVEAEEGAGLLDARLRIDERVLHALTGVDTLDRRLARAAASGPVSGGLSDADRAAAARIARVWTLSRAWADCPVAQLCGAAPEVRALAAEVCRGLGLQLLILPAAAMSGAGLEEADLGRLCEREFLLGGRVLMIDAAESSPGDGLRLDHLIDTLEAPLILGVTEPRPAAWRPSLTVEVQPLSLAERRGRWQAVLQDDGADPQLVGDLDRLSAQFRLGEPQMLAACADATGRAGEPATPPPAGWAGPLSPVGRALWNACRDQSRARMDELAARIDVRADWDDLVLPDRTRRQLEEIVQTVSGRYTVYESWGFGAKSDRGLGVAALFAGASGAGKTMAAEVLAGSLGVDLYRIDLSRVVSKYIGETEKHLRRLFDAAEAGGAALLFDEADALFGKRSEVKDSHDRFSNIEVSYLLQRFETYGGLAILTTNLKDAIDHAFLRRFRFVVDFPHPGAEQRARMWRRAFPPKTPVEALDYERLAALSATGGVIRNIALSAAFLAAAEGGPVTMERLARATRGEYAKLGRVAPQTELEGWDAAS
jgi:hypothetical protein